MALSLLKKATSRGAQEIASWGAKTYQFTFANESEEAVRVLLEEDPEAVLKLEQWKLGDGIPIVGKAEKRHARRLRELKKSILATSKPFQEFVLIRDQLKTVNMRSPVCKCSIALTKWNGCLKIVEIQRQVAETETFLVHSGYGRSPGYGTLRADLLEHALRAAGVQLGFDFRDDESEMLESLPSKSTFADMSSLTASTGSEEVESTDESFHVQPASARSSAKATPFNEMCAVPAMHAMENQASFVGSWHCQAQSSRRLPVIQLPVVSEAQETIEPATPGGQNGFDTGFPQGFLPIDGSVLLLWRRRWLPARLAGISIGTSAVEGCLYVEYTDPFGQMGQQMVLPDQIPRMLRSL